MTELKEIAKNNGLTMKSLAKKSGIKYTTLMSMSNTPLSHWSTENIKSLSKSLNMDEKSFQDSINGIILTPFIKWVGGKRQLLSRLNHWMPKNFNRYFEPFVGGGALLLNVAPKHAVINDFNPELTNAYTVVRDHVYELSDLLKVHQESDSKEYYMNIRSADRDRRIIDMSSIERAARFIYMNKAGYNGLWRVNANGQNNVPYGDHSHLTLITDNLFNVSNYLQNNDIEILTGNYQNAILNAKIGDFVYFDPPYIPVNATAAFTSYTANKFGLIQQEQLRDTAIKLAERGVQVMLSNADVPLIKELYKKEDGFYIHREQATRAINSVATKRGKVGEVIITTY